MVVNKKGTRLKKTGLKKIFLSIITIGLLFVLASCYDGYGKINDKNLQSTDLSNIMIAGLKLGLNTNDIEMSVFRQTDRGYILYGFVNNELLTTVMDETYPDEVRIDVDPNGTITRIDGRVHIGLGFEINGTNTPQTLQEIKELLGNNYNDYLYSKEIRYNGLTYTDTENEIILTFLYSMDDDRLIWVILSLP
jgi:hypothetical protein